METTTLKTTPLHETHIALGAKMVPFAGYDMPVQYPTGVLEETKACRQHIGLFDVSHMGQFSIKGKNALLEVQKLVTNDLSKLEIGQAQYNMLCNEKGGVIDDLVIYRRALDHIYICVNAANREADFSWMSKRLSHEVIFNDESDSTALIAVQGPKSEAFLSQLTQSRSATQLKYYWAQEDTIDGIPVYLSRTGYTGEDGFEIYLPSKDTVKLWNKLMSAGKEFLITPCGLGARDTLRLEMGYPLHGHELSEAINPLQAGLSWVVKLKKETAFVGQSTLVQEAAQGPNTVLRAYRVNDRRIARQGYSVFDLAGKKVGYITSGTFSPHLEGPIALAMVDHQVADSDKLWVEIRNSKIEMTKVKLPFVPSRTKKS